VTRNACLVFARGCFRSQVDLVRVRAYLEANSWVVVNRVRDADLVVVSACAFTATEQKTSEKYLDLILREKRGDAPLVIVGCLAGIVPAVAASRKALALTTDNLAALDSLIEAAFDHS
jgi:tRNA A37 methylthiotransferase MiaB